MRLLVLLYHYLIPHFVSVRGIRLVDAQGRGVWLPIADINQVDPQWRHRVVRVSGFVLFGRFYIARHKLPST